MEDASQVITFILIALNVLLSLLAFFRNKYHIANFHLGWSILLSLILRLP